MATLETATDTDDDDLLTPREVAQILRCSVHHLSRLRTVGGGPPYAKFDDAQQGRVFYRRGDVRAYIRRSVVRSSSDVAARIADFSGAPRVIA